MSNTPDMALEYSDGKAPEKKSLLANTWLLKAEIPPPPNEFRSAKWLGLKTSTPSKSDANKAKITLHSSISFYILVV